MNKTLIAALIALGLLMPFFVSGCNSQKESAAGEGFAIYLTRDNVPVSQMEALSHIEIAAAPVIALNDIVTYHWDTHGIEVTSEAYDRLDKLEVPTSGKSFVVCVDKAPIYWGAFWAGYSSQSFDGVIINVKPIFPVEGSQFSFQIRLGYPSPSFYHGQDPRSNPEIRQSLVAAGKLK